MVKFYIQKKEFFGESNKFWRSTGKFLTLIYTFVQKLIYFS